MTGRVTLPPSSGSLPRSCPRARPGSRPRSRRRRILGRPGRDPRVHPRRAGGSHGEGGAARQFARISQPVVHPQAHANRPEASRRTPGGPAGSSQRQKPGRRPCQTRPAPRRGDVEPQRLHELRRLCKVPGAGLQRFADEAKIAVFQVPQPAVNQPRGAARRVLPEVLGGGVAQGLWLRRVSVGARRPSASQEGPFRPPSANQTVQPSSTQGPSAERRGVGPGRSRSPSQLNRSGRGTRFLALDRRPGVWQGLAVLNNLRQSVLRVVVVVGGAAGGACRG